ncbi:hypothetical protein pipiens_008306 [Culex pipiens pipiens]|uniref:Nose resistant-to-fluoxetine protein N-terminal domain-containing protein n=1 Tax=Culex pipiens pipiens TaxID=38569 RepID=A0ABD1DIR4_CULPP
MECFRESAESGYDVTQVEPSSEQRCVSTLKELSEAYVNRNRHGLEWFDSWGKIPSGLYYGNGYAIGNYEQCRRFSWKDVRGQHCTFMAAFPNEFSVFYSGLCVPQFCTQQVVQELYTKYMFSRGVRVLASSDRCYKDRELEFNGAVVAAM